MLREESSVLAAPKTLFSYLRADTQPLHTRFENNLGLLRAPVSKERVAQTLERFASFHRSWEPALETYPDLKHAMAGKSRLHHAEHDLAVLDTAQGTTAPRYCAGVDALLTSAAHAMGSVYVMQGSTLGGAVIARALRPVDWFPHGGLHYFAPPDRDVREDWLELQRWADGRWVPATWPAIAAGARQTFVFLEAWLNIGGLNG